LLLVQHIDEWNTWAHSIFGGETQPPLDSEHGTTMHDKCILALRKSILAPRFANYVCGLIDYQKACNIIRSTKGFPRRRLADEESRRSLRAQVGPLLTDSAANFLRSLEIDPNNSDAMTSLGHVRSEQGYIAESTDESARFRA
jgi:hypothetical protein